MLIVNADDWGRCAADTDAARTAFSAGAVTSATAMVHMADSVRSAAQALELGVPVGLHLNFTERFTAGSAPESLRRAQEQIGAYLSSHRLAPLVYNPALRAEFAPVVRAQLEEFRRLFGKEPTHFDGHEHMHLCANMLAARPIPVGSKLRMSFTYCAGEKSALNRAYRACVNAWMRRWYRQADYFFDLAERMAEREFERVCTLARHAEVELMCHPARQDEQAYFLSQGFLTSMRKIRLGSYEALQQFRGRASVGC